MVGKMETVARKSGKSGLGSLSVKAVDRGRAAVRLLIPLEVQRQPADQRRLGPYPIHRLLYLPVPPVAALDRVGRGGEQPVVEEGQGLFQVRRMQLVQTPPQAAVTPHTLPQAGQLGQRRLR